MSGDDIEWLSNLADALERARGTRRFVLADFGRER